MSYLYSNEIGTGYISLTSGPKKVKFAVIDGMAIFEGDIILGTVEEIRAFSRDVEKAVVISFPERRWPSGLVPFEVDPNLPDPQRVYITNAIAHWESRTTIRFQERTANNASLFPNFVVFSRHPNLANCSSWVGMLGGRQDIFLGAFCSESTIIHEIGHTVGFWHEQSREDRDRFVTIIPANIISGSEDNFDQHVTDGDDIGLYDYCSIMHYSAYAFSNGAGPTIQVLQPSLPCGTSIGLGNSLSNGDVEAINHIYGDRLLPRYGRHLYTINGIVGVSGFFDPITNGTYIIVGTSDGKILENNSPLSVSFPAGNIVSVSGYFNPDEQLHTAIVGTTAGEVHDIWWQGGGGASAGSGVLPVNFGSGNIVSVSGYFNPDEQRHVVMVGKTSGKIHNIWWKSGMSGIEGHGELPGIVLPGIVSVSGFFSSQEHRNYVIVGRTNGMVHKITWKLGGDAIEGHFPVMFNQGSSIVSVSGYYSSGNQANNVTVGTGDGKLRDIYWESELSEVLGPYVLKAPFPANSIIGLVGFYVARGVPYYHVIVGTTDGVHDLTSF